jgi:hypothetical protein
MSGMIDGKPLIRQDDRIAVSGKRPGQQISEPLRPNGTLLQDNREAVVAKHDMLVTRTILTHAHLAMECPRTSKLPDDGPHAV